MRHLVLRRVNSFHGASILFNPGSVEKPIYHRPNVAEVLLALEWPLKLRV
jgi:hypothetical protein